MAGSEQDQEAVRPSEQRGGSTPDEAEAAERRVPVAEAPEAHRRDRRRQGVTVADPGWSGPPRAQPAVGQQRARSRPAAHAVHRAAGMHGGSRDV
jgi:hypothetical protein